ncbi:MAG: hypothetical protein ABIK85_08680, partial [Candidatus Eisenbacteria bacterium]
MPFMMNMIMSTPAPRETRAVRKLKNMYTVASSSFFRRGRPEGKSSSRTYGRRQSPLVVLFSVRYDTRPAEGVSRTWEVVGSRVQGAPQGQDGAALRAKPLGFVGGSGSIVG